MADRLVYFEPGLPGIPEALLLARDRGEVLFLTGAGVSTPPPSSLPNFKGLVVDIYRQLDRPLATALEAWIDAIPPSGNPLPDWSLFATGLNAKEQTEFKRFAAGEYDVALGMLERRMASVPGQTTSMRSVAARVLNAAKTPNVLHASLDRLARRFGEVFIATTNFDRLHENQAGPPSASRSFGLNALPRPSRRADFHGVFHIHGVLPTNAKAPIDIVLSDQDFGDVYLRRRTASDFIYDAVRIFHLVIIGYSLNDAPFRYLVNAVAGDGLHFPDLKTRFAIVPRHADDPTIAEEWDARSITPVCYDDADHHLQLQRLLAAWAQSVPDDGPDDWSRDRLKAMCAVPWSEACEADQSVFGYIVRRSTSLERGTLADYLGAIDAPPDWIDEANRILRAGEGRL